MAPPTDRSRTVGNTHKERERDDDENEKSGMKINFSRGKKEKPDRSQESADCWTIKCGYWRTHEAADGVNSNGRIPFPSSRNLVLSNNREQLFYYNLLIRHVCCVTCTQSTLRLIRIYIEINKYLFIHFFFKKKSHYRLEYDMERLGYT